MKFLRHLTLAALLMAAVFLLRGSAAVHLGIERGLTLCLHSVLPSLFPFFVLSSLLLSLGFVEGLGRLLAPMMERLFHLGGNGAAALALGLIAGYPSGARTVCRLYESHLCGREEAERLLGFCNNAGAAFFLSYLGAGLFGLREGMWLWLIHVLAALLTGMLLRPRRTLSLERRPARANPPGFFAAFPAAVQSGFSSFLSVCGFVLLFSVLMQPLRTLLGETPLLGIIELFGGVSALDTSPRSFLLAAALTGFGGLSVHAQAASFFSAAGLSGRWHLRGKILHALLSFLLAALFLLLP